MDVDKVFTNSTEFDSVKVTGQVNMQQDMGSLSSLPQTELWSMRAQQTLSLVGQALHLRRLADMLTVFDDKGFERSETRRLLESRARRA